MPDVPALVIFGTSFLVGLSGAVSPGPLLAFNIRETVRHGFMAGPYVAAGHALLELATVAALTFGLTRIRDFQPAVAAIGILGGLFLVWMGAGMLRNPGHGAPTFQGHASGVPSHGVRESVVGGVVVSLSNPYWTLWWLTVGAAFMARSVELGVVGIAAFYLGHILSDFCWYSLVSAALASGRRLVTVRVYKVVMLACGAFLTAMGVYFVVTGVRLLA